MSKPAEDRPFTMGNYRVEVVVIAHPDRTEIRRPDMDEPIILRNGEQLRIGLGSYVTVEGFIEGFGWESTDG